MRALPVLALVAATSALLGCSSRPAARPVAEIASPAPTATASPTPAPAQPVYPLTGLPVSDPALAARPALSVKIDNVGAALPQVGLNSADLVADILVEGGLTRLMATYQSHDATQVGPIRSARPVDADLLRQLNGGIFAYAGADPREIAPSKDHSTALLVALDTDPSWFYRSSSKPAPHNLFSSTRRLYTAGRVMRPSLPAPTQLFAYGQVSSGATPARAVSIRFSPQSTAGWTWTGSSYSRTQDGRPDRLLSGDRVSTTNVVVMSVSFYPTRIRDDAGNYDPYVVVIGSGPVVVMRDGVAVTGRWVRPSYRVPMQLLDAHGRVIPLHPGRTWLELQPQPFMPALS